MTFRAVDSDARISRISDARTTLRSCSRSERTSRRKLRGTRNNPIPVQPGGSHAASPRDPAPNDEHAKLGTPETLATVGAYDSCARHTPKSADERNHTLDEFLERSQTRSGRCLRLSVGLSDTRMRLPPNGRLNKCYKTQRTPVCLCRR